MEHETASHKVTDLATLERIYGAPGTAAIVKEVDHVHPHYRAFVEAAPFAVLATSGPNGMDASPRGDAPGFVVVQDEKTLLLPDRRGNNRIDSLRNILTDARVALLLMIPGIGETLRVNGRAEISIAPDLLERLSVAGKPPCTVLVIHVESVFFQCSRAVLRSRIWDPASRVERSMLPSTGTILETLSESAIEAGRYDAELPGRLARTMY